MQAISSEFLWFYLENKYFESLKNMFEIKKKKNDVRWKWKFNSYSTIIFIQNKCMNYVYISNFELFLIKLWSLSEPPTVVVTLPNYAVDFGRQVALGCTVTANPAHTSVNWKKIKNGVSTDIEMANSGKYSGSSVSSPSLVINNANLDDEASYVCYATNSIGTGQSTSTVLDVVGSKYKQ